MRRLQREMERLFGDGNWMWRSPLGGEYPPINLTRNDEGITLDVLCPGVRRESLDVSVVGDAVTVRGERQPEPNAPETYHKQERPLGTFTRTVRIGERLDPDHTQANYGNGILQVLLSRAPEAAPKKITIQS
jgi:HSP20 family protein